MIPVPAPTSRIKASLLSLNKNSSSSAATYFLFLSSHCEARYRKILSMSKVGEQTFYFGCFLTDCMQMKMKNWTRRAVADLHSKILDACPPRGSKFFEIHAVFGKIWQNHMLAPLLGSWRPLLGEILDPPLEGYVHRWHLLLSASDLPMVVGPKP